MLRAAGPNWRSLLNGKVYQSSRSYLLPLAAWSGYTNLQYVLAWGCVRFQMINSLDIITRQRNGFLIQEVPIAKDRQDTSAPVTFAESAQLVGKRLPRMERANCGIALHRRPIEEVSAGLLIERLGCRVPTQPNA
jgi:hypothetical protein